MKIKTKPGMGKQSNWIACWLVWPQWEGMHEQKLSISCFYLLYALVSWSHCSSWLVTSLVTVKGSAQEVGSWLVTTFVHLQLKVKVQLWIPEQLSHPHDPVAQFDVLWKAKWFSLSSFWPCFECVVSFGRRPSCITAMWQFLVGPTQKTCTSC